MGKGTTLFKKSHISVERVEAQNQLRSEKCFRPQWSRDDWYEYLSQPGRQLVELHAMTEDRFLYFGSFLNNFHKRAKSVSALAVAIRARMVGDEAAGGIEKLQMLVERMSTFLHDIQTTSGRNEQALTLICAALERLHHPLRAFQKITKTLQVVGITTRVECSGFSVSQDNAMNLSESIRRLGSLISLNMNEIVDQVSVLSSLSKEALRNESALNKGHSTRAMVVVEQARSVLAQLVENSKEAMQQSESLTKASSAVTQSTAEIVSSIQFHDITRQQIEHVTETIESFSLSISESFQSGDDRDRQALEQEIADGCRLQSEQLKNSGRELTSAVWRIIESLQTLALNVKTVAKDTRELSGDAERDGAGFFKAIDPAIASVAAVLADNMATAAHSAQAVTAVVSAATTMVQLVEEVERFGAEMKVIALNASIESVHVKAGGAALGVIADSIQELARDALLQTDELVSGLTAITESADTLHATNRGEDSAQDADITNLTADSALMLTELRQTNALLLENFARMDRQADSLAMDISAAASSIQLQFEANQIITKGVESLAYIANQFNSPLQSVKKQGSTTLLKEMQERYSMKSERDVHDSMIERGWDKSEPSPKRRQKEGALEEQNHDFGANVELF